ncbi:MAG: hypothetical protein QF609_12980 [Gammaproteobacteria bacterium]|jgi:hypothetical protein|nr:hypothetical protein [Gammaproteobacteria bacterium]|tara:strand:+ start:526 stop:723 length:198 start_codon:yes stop_codon:yes gene_type:complete
MVGSGAEPSAGLDSLPAQALADAAINAYYRTDIQGAVILMELPVAIVERVPLRWVPDIVDEPDPK